MVTISACGQNSSPSRTPIEKPEHRGANWFHPIDSQFYYHIGGNNSVQGSYIQFRFPNRLQPLATDLSIAILTFIMVQQRLP
jgi:hypothetical protein